MYAIRSYYAAKCGITSNITFEDKQSFNYGRFMSRNPKRRTHYDKNLDELCKAFNLMYNDDANKNMPTYANYSVNRA